MAKPSLSLLNNREEFIVLAGPIPKAVAITLALFCWATTQTTECCTTPGVWAPA